MAVGGGWEWEEVSEGGGPLLLPLQLSLSNDWLLLRAEDIQADSVCGGRGNRDEKQLWNKHAVIIQAQWSEAIITSLLNYWWWWWWSWSWGHHSRGCVLCPIYASTLTTELDILAHQDMNWRYPDFKTMVYAVLPSQASSRPFWRPVSLPIKLKNVTFRFINLFLLSMCIDDTQCHGSTCMWSGNENIAYTERRL